MIKKKLVINLFSIAIVGIATTSIVAGYVFGKENNRFNVFTSIPISSSENDLIQSYFSSAVNGSKLLYLCSYIHTVPLTTGLNISEKTNSSIYNYLSKVGYVLIDDQYGIPFFNQQKGGLEQRQQPIWSTNVASVQFRADLGSFITGIAAAQFLNENKDYFKQNENDTLKWATYGGMDLPTVTCFMGGFQRGIEWFNENIVGYVDGFEKIEHYILGEENNKNFIGSFEPTAANDLVNLLLNAKVNLLLPVAGPQIPQIARLIKQRDNIRTVVVGVDSAIEEDTGVNIKLSHLKENQKVGNNQIIQFSSVKNINNAVDRITTKINEAKQPDNNIGGIGYSSLGNLENDGVGVSEQGKEYFAKAMMLYAKIKNKNFDTIDIDISKLTSNPISNDDKNTVINIENAKNSYSLGISVIEKLQFYKELDDANNKYYSINNNKKFSYSGISNNGIPMIPITAKDKSEIESWYDDYLIDKDPSYSKFRDVNINSMWEWIQNNQQSINKRKQLDLKDQLNKENYEQNSSIIKIVFQSPTSILFDKSFLESCYIGLYQYLSKKGADIPPPPSK